MSRGRFYAADLAYAHDRGFGSLAAAAGDELASRLHRAGLGGGRVVDLGCGSGILAARMLAAGSPVVGVDVSPAMIALARKRARGARFRVASLVDAPLPPCEAIAMAGEVLNYLRDPRLGGREAVARVLRRCHAALRPDGLLLFDVRVVSRGRRPLLREVFHEGEDWAVAARVEVDPSRRRLIREVTVFRRRGRSFRRSHEKHEVRLYDAAELSRALRRAGFAVRRLGGYAGLRFGSDRAGFLARRR